MLPDDLIEQRKRQKTQDRVVWDGHVDSMQSTVNLDAQIRMLHATKGSEVVHDNPEIGPRRPQGECGLLCLFFSPLLFLCAMNNFNNNNTIRTLRRTMFAYNHIF